MSDPPILKLVVNVKQHDMTRKARIMRKSSFGAAAKPRPSTSKHVLSTPCTRRPYLGECTSQKKERMHPSGDDTCLPSALHLSSKYTPLQSTKFTPKSSNAFAQVNKNILRSSVESVRSSGIGGFSKKDLKALSDPTMKSQYVDNIQEFLAAKNINVPRRILLTPTNSDFWELFNYIYGFFDPNYKLPQRFEEQIPRLLEALMYPVRLNKSSLLTVGNPRTWPQLLGALNYMITSLKLSEVIDYKFAFGTNFPDNPSMGFESCSTILNVIREGDEVGILQEYSEKLKKLEAVTDNELISTESENGQLLQDIEQCQERTDVCDTLQSQYLQCCEDKGALSSYCQELQTFMEVRHHEKLELKKRNEELQGNLETIREDIEVLRDVKLKQKYSMMEVEKIKNYSSYAKGIISQYNQHTEDIKNKNWNIELELSKTAQELQSLISNMNNCVEDELRILPCSSLEEQMNKVSWLDTAHTQKRKALKHDVLNLQSELRQLEEKKNEKEDKYNENMRNLMKERNRISRHKEEIVSEKEVKTSKIQELEERNSQLEMEISALRKKISHFSSEGSPRLQQKKEELAQSEKMRHEFSAEGLQMFRELCTSVIDTEKSMRRAREETWNRIIIKHNSAVDKIKEVLQKFAEE